MDWNRKKKEWIKTWILSLNPKNHYLTILAEQKKNLHFNLFTFYENIKPFSILKWIITFHAIDLNCVRRGIRFLTCKRELDVNTHQIWSLNMLTDSKLTFDEPCEMKQIRSAVVSNEMAHLQAFPSFWYCLYLKLGIEKQNKIINQYGKQDTIPILDNPINSSNYYKRLNCIDSCCFFSAKIDEHDSNLCTIPRIDLFNQLICFFFFFIIDMNCDFFILRFIKVHINRIFVIENLFVFV